MNHAAKRAGRRKHRRLRRWFCLVGIWAAALAVLLALGALEHRAQSAPVGVRLSYRGQARQVDAAGLTAAQLLKRLGLALTPEDTVTPAADAVLTDGDVVTVTRRQTRREEYTQALPAGIEYRLDAALPWGQEAELNPGTAGELRCVAEVEYINGVETGREVVSKELISPAQPRLVAVGTRETEAPLAEGGCLWLPGGQLLTYTKALTLEATAFTSTDPGCLPGARQGTAVVAARFIPPGTRLFIASADGAYTYGIAQAAAGDSMEGDRIDLYLDPAESAEFGRKQCIVYFLG